MRGNMIMELNNIYCGDCLELINKIDSIDLVIMSPPDLISFNDDLKKYKKFINDIYSKCFDKLNDHGVLVSITTDRKFNKEIYTKHIDIIKAVGVNPFQYKIWCKSLKPNWFILNYSHILCFRKGKKYTSNKLKEWLPDVFVIETDKIRGYPARDSFPSGLINMIIKKFTKEGNLVLDPFIGSGKTAIECINLHRNFIGFEINNDHYNVAKKLIERKLIE